MNEQSTPHLGPLPVRGGEGEGPSNQGFCIFIDALLEGPVPLVRDGRGKPVVFATESDAQREIADHQITRLQEFLDGAREFEDAMTVEEYIVPVEVSGDGAIKFKLAS